MKGQRSAIDIEIKSCQITLHGDDVVNLKKCYPNF